jgi:hypothetical protein
MPAFRSIIFLTNGIRPDSFDTNKNKYALSLPLETATKSAFSPTAPIMEADAQDVAPNDDDPIRNLSTHAAASSIQKDPEPIPSSFQTDTEETTKSISLPPTLQSGTDEKAEPDNLPSLQRISGSTFASAFGPREATETKAKNDDGLYLEDLESFRVWYAMQNRILQQQ